MSFIGMKIYKKANYTYYYYDITPSIDVDSIKIFNFNVNKIQFNQQPQLSLLFGTRWAVGYLF